ncbi:hypothetical protein DUGA6_63120 [Duganella sp. HH105]|nr:hypothetical protein DUGA6_63120 [Duganella sp. HH105]
MCRRCRCRCRCRRRSRRRMRRGSRHLMPASRTAGRRAMHARRRRLRSRSRRRCDSRPAGSRPALRRQRALQHFYLALQLDQLAGQLDTMRIEHRAFFRTHAGWRTSRRSRRPFHALRQRQRRQGQQSLRHAQRHAAIGLRHLAAGRRLGRHRTHRRPPRWRRRRPQAARLTHLRLMHRRHRRRPRPVAHRSLRRRRINRSRRRHLSRLGRPSLRRHLRRRQHRQRRRQRRRIRIRLQPHRRRAHIMAPRRTQLQEQMDILGIDIAGRRQMQELAPVAPHHRHMNAGQRRIHRNAGAAIHIRLRQPHLQRRHLVRRQLHQLDIGRQGLADERAHRHLPQFRRRRGSRQRQCAGASKDQGQERCALHVVVAWPRILKVYQL